MAEFGTLAWRFAVGAPLSGRSKTDATFFLAGTKVIGDRTRWGDVSPTGWSYLPGWKRALIRWAVLGGVLLVSAMTLGVWPWTWQTIAVFVLLIAGWLRWRWPRWRRRRHERRVVQPLAAALGGLLGVSAAGAVVPPWLRVPVDYKTNPNVLVELDLPPQFAAEARQQTAINALIGARLGGEWDSHWRTEHLSATWTRAPQAPRSASYEPSRDEYRVTLGRSKRDEPVSFELGSETANMLVSAAPGAGKTSVIRLINRHGHEHDWLIDMIDPKRRSYVDKKTGRAVYPAGSVRLHTDIESQIQAVEDYFLSMDGLNAAVDRGELSEADVPRRLLIIDEMTSFIDYARNHYRRAGGKGDLPFGIQFQYLATQGREAEHRMVVAPHQPDSKVFGGTAVRTSFAGRIVLGAMTRTLWMTAFGYQKQVPYDSRHKGRGLVGLGEGVPEEVQLAWVSPAEATAAAERFLERGAAPEWWRRGLLPPWVTEATIANARQVAGVGWLSHPEQRLSHPGTTAPDVAGHVPPREREESINGHDRPSLTVITGGGGVLVPAPRGEVAEPPGEPLIVGLAAAAAFLGYDKPETFRRARGRAKAAGDPIPGETRNAAGEPCFTPSGLRSWQSKRKLAGARPIPAAVES